jgi:hypothetical protein
MTAEEFFRSAIFDVIGVEINKESTVYTKPVGNKYVWIATLEKMIDRKGVEQHFLWVSWPKVVRPLMDHYKMTEDGALEFIKNQLTVSLVGFMPSAERFLKDQIIHTEENKLIDDNRADFKT